MSPVTCQLTTFNPRTDFALSNGFRSPASDYLSGAMFIAYVATLRTALWRAAYRDDMLKGLADKMLIEIYALHNA
jgi:hypothetical protein